MPKVIDVQPRDIYFLIEFGLEELKKLHTALGMTFMNYDGTKPEEVSAAIYLEEIWNFLDDVIKEKKDGS